MSSASSSWESVHVEGGVGVGSQDSNEQQWQRSHTRQEPIAILGMGCRLPGSIYKPSDLWTFLAEKRSGYRDFDSSRINIDGYYHPNDKRPGSIHTKGAQLLDRDPRLFDHGFFSMSAAEVLTMDPLQRKILEVSYEAMEAAGETWDTFYGSKTGVFMGNMNLDGYTQPSIDRDFAMPYTGTGSAPAILSNRISHLLNLKGPSLTIDTACASSMYALHLAVAALRNGDCDAAIVGGMNLILNPDMQQMVVDLGAASGTSTCHTFDAAADGYCRAEGFGAIYLRRYTDAIMKECPIRAVVRATGVNHNGRSAGISHPSSEGQDTLIRHVYEKAGLAPQLTGYVECHGTGTAVGDPLEVSAVARVFNEGRSTTDEPLLVGSVKTNLGHSEAASGVTGIIKSVLAIEKGMIPATIGITKLNPNIDFEAKNVKVVTEMTPWPSSKLRRVSVNSFGFGGANGHVILDHPDIVAMEMAQRGILRPASPATHRSLLHLDPDTGLATPPLSARSDASVSEEKQYPQTRRLTLLPFSAHDREALIANVSALSVSIASLPLADVAYTLAKHRSRLLYKTFAVVDSASPADGISSPPTNIGKSASTQQAKIGFVFTGQGAQWKEMGRTLFEYPVFAASVRAMDRVLSGLSTPPTWSLKAILSGKSDRSVQEAEISQSVCAALQIAVVDLLRSWNVVPHVTVGHSSGEIAAAYASGRVTRSEAIVLGYCRSRAIASNSQTGAMMAVGLGLEQANALLVGLESQIKVAAVNSPRGVTLSGDADAIKSLHEKLEAEGTFARLLQTDNNAYHSHHMIPIGEIYEEMVGKYLAEIQDDAQRAPACSWVSSVTPGKDVSTTARYWRDNLEGTVLFSPAVERLVSDRETQVDILIEIGPHSALQGPIKQILSAAASTPGTKLPVYLSALRRFEDNMNNILTLCGSLFQLNANVDLLAVNSIERTEESNRGGYIQARAPKLCVNMPTYQYTYGPVLLYESRISRETRSRKNLHHDLLGILRPGGSKDQPVWRNVLRMKDVPWLSDHRLIPNAVLPGAAYVGLAIEAASQHVRGRGNLTDASFTLRNIHIKNALIVPDDEYGIEVMTSISTSTFSNTWFHFSVTSVDREGTWGDHASGLITVAKSASDGVTDIVRLDDKLDRRYIDVRRWYSKFEEIGLGYGKSFQGLSNLVTDPYKDIAVADVDLKPTEGMFNGPESGYAIHPATLDVCFQASIIATHGGQVGKVEHGLIPVFIEEISVWPARSDEAVGKVVAYAEKRGLRNSVANIQVYDQSGLPRVDVKNLRGVRYDGGNPMDNTTKSNEYVRLVWKPDISMLSDAQAQAVVTSDSAARSRLAGVIDLMGHRNPGMKALQIGLDHTVSTTVLSILGGHTDTLRYESFALADKADEAVRDAVAALSEYKNTSTRHFDLEKEDQAQDVEDGFDLVILADVHTIKDISLMLLRLRFVMKTDARIIILGSEAPKDEWQQALQANIFSGVDIAFEKDEANSSIIVSSTTEGAVSKPAATKFVYLIYQHTISTFHQALASELNQKHLIPVMTTLADASRVPPGSRVIVTLDLEGGLSDASEQEYNGIKSLARNVSSLLWLTKGDILRGHEPQAAIATGLMRILTSEVPETKFSIFHLETSYENTASVSARQVCEHEVRVSEGGAGLETEVALRDGIAHIPRLVYDSGLSSRLNEAKTGASSTVIAPIHAQGPMRVDFGTPGLLSSAYFRPDKSLDGLLPEDWVEIKTAAIGLNWKDVAVTSARVTSRMDVNACSYECAGTVVACGSQVTQFQPGDRVYGLSYSWFGTHIRTHAGWLQKMEDGAKPEQMCTTPLTFCSAVYALVHLGRIKKGDRVLIQTATGGLGLAALQIAKAYGAEIFATAGTSEKRAYLVEHCDIPADHVFHSREESALSGLMEATRGKGFNIILSTSSGDMLHATWRCIASRGHLVDVARVDVIEHSVISMEVFERNGTFSSFDFSVMMKQEPDFVASIMEEVDSLLRAGTIKPVEEIHSYDVSKLETALLTLSRGKHVGKFAVTYEDPDAMVKMVAPVPRASFSADADYVLVGGLGGFGRSIVRWFAARGAKHLTILRRSTAVDEEAQMMIEDLASQGITVSLRKVDVTSREQVQDALADVARIRPVKGIINAAMQPVDTAFDKLPYENWKLGLSAKVQGSINLHEASMALDLPLDFFVMTGSIMAVLALPTNATYCASNGFQEAFARYRRSLGLPACTIGFGPITEITEVARLDVVVKSSKRQQLYMDNGELETLQLLEAAFLECPAGNDGTLEWQTHDPLAASTITAFWDPVKLARTYDNSFDSVWLKNKKYLHVVRALKNEREGSDRPLQAQDGKRAVLGAVDDAVGSGSNEQALDLVVGAIVERIAGLLELEKESIDPDRGVAEYGVDSLIAVELRNWFLAVLDQTIPLLKLLGDRTTIRTLAEDVIAARSKGVE